MTLLSLLRRLLGRGSPPDITHTLLVGATRSGKSEAELARLVPTAKANDRAIVLMDPPGTLAAKLLLHLDALGLTDRVLYDRLSDTDRVPGYDWLVASTAPDPLQREAENDERIREFASILLRRRGLQDAARHPLIEETILFALRLYVYQATPVPLPWLADVFRLGSPAGMHLLTHCTEPELVRKWEEYRALSRTLRRTELAPAERILQAVCLSPAFRIRSQGATFDLRHFLDDRGILILDGSSQGNLSRDAASVMMGALILRVLQHCRTGATSRVLLVLDEAVNAELIGVQESRALAEAGKWGLEAHILVQDPFAFPTAEIRANALQNTWRHEWFRQGSPEAARLAAEDLAIPLLDPFRLHHTDERIRTVDSGHEVLQVASRSEWAEPGGKRRTGWGWREVLWPRRREVREALPRYTSLSDQILLMQRTLMQLQPGYRFVRSDTVTPTPQYVAMLKDPAGRNRRGAGRGPGVSGSPASRFQQVLRRIKQRSVFRAVESGSFTHRPPRPASNLMAARGARGG